MQRISVDLPEPDGPQMTMRSPRPTCRSMSRSTWKLLPYHLLTLSNAMMVSLMGRPGAVSSSACLLRLSCFSTHRL